jgi:hypothetical protein
MSKLVEEILNKNYESANEVLEEQFRTILERKMCEMKKMTAAKMTEDDDKIRQGVKDLAKQMGFQGSSASEYKDSETKDGKTTTTTIRQGDQSTLPSLSRVNSNSSNSTKFPEPAAKPKSPSLLSRATSALGIGSKSNNSGPTTTKDDPKKLRGVEGYSNTSRLKNFEEQYTDVERKRRLRVGVLEQEESGEESSMARSELSAIVKDAKSIMSKVKGNKELEAWTQSKITKSADYMNAVADYMDNEGKLDEARINIVKARIRGGVLQRRKKVSNVPGMTIRGGQLKRMSAAERRRRKLGAKKAQLKTRGKQVQVQRNRKLSLMKRKRLGL